MSQGQRRLAAIMFADLASFSRLTREDEPLAIEIVNSLRARLAEVAREHGGVLVKSMGDGFLIEFQSSLEAVKFALAVQRSLHEGSWDELAQRCPPLKIGIHMGDVEHKGPDVFGDTVNVASRVELHAGHRGGIVITSPVFEDVSGKVQVRIHPAGKLELANNKRVRLYRIHLPWHHEFVIMTTTIEEFEAVKSKFQLAKPSNIGGADYSPGSVVTPGGAMQYSIACIRLTNPGNLESKSATRRILDYVHPTFILLVGTAGGIKGRWGISLGDVVVSRAVLYDSKKDLPRGMDMFWGTLQPPSKTLRDSFHRIQDANVDWWQSLGSKPDKDPSSAKAVEADIISGDTLRANPSSDDMHYLIDRFPEAVAYEMEAAGVANALWEEEETRRKPGYIVLKGISGWVNAGVSEDQETRNTWRDYASRAAAEMAYAIVSYTEIR